MPTIQILDDHLVSQIAAGEVVERPASVVKELVENALDAGATFIAVDLEHGGKRRIRVQDDGHGLGRDDGLLAFDRHATSKIGSFEDLQEVASLGFRGEALASIAAVSRVELVSAPASGEGHRVRIEGGKVRSAEPAPHPTGTTVEVASLFYNVPARRKFLKSPQTELGRVTEVVQGYALARPEVGFSLRHGGRLLLETQAAGPGSEGALRRIGDLFGASLQNALTPISSEVETGPETFWGFVGDPSTTRGRRYFTFVNRRLLRDRAVMATFYRSVREAWRSEDFPALFLFVDVPAAEVDVNVHPQKAEVRFRDPQLLGRLGRALRAALAAALGERTAPLRGMEGAGPPAPLSWQGLGERPRETWATSEGADGRGFVAEPGPLSQVPRIAETAYAPAQRGVVPLSGRSGELRAFRFLGQYKATLLLLEGPDGLYIVDQHVAHERVLYERFRRALLAAEPVVQNLLEPVLLDLSASEHLRLTGLAEKLAACGFDVVELSGGTLALKAVPAELGTEEATALLARLAARSDTDEEVEPAVLRDRLLESLAADQSCKAAVKMHEPLSPQEAEALLTELFEAEQPYACPHGRPIVLKMSDVDLERRFGRR